MKDEGGDRKGRKEGGRRTKEGGRRKEKSDRWAARNGGRRVSR